MAVTDGWKAGHVEVSPAAKTLLLLDQLQTFCAQFHSLLLSKAIRKIDRAACVFEVGFSSSECSRSGVYSYVNML
jgi:hypothetical protein